MLWISDIFALLTVSIMYVALLVDANQILFHDIGVSSLGIVPAMSASVGR
jgi:hypothetical protein